jgi:hypothetical protein
MSDEKTTRAMTAGQAQLQELKLQALRHYFDFSDGRPSTEDVAKKMDLPVRTIQSWFADDSIGELVKHVVPVWQNTQSAHMWASEHWIEALENVLKVMRSTKSDAARLQAASIIMGLAGVTNPKGDVEREEKGEQKRPPVLVNLFVGGAPVGGAAPEIVDAEVRQLP